MIKRNNGSTEQEKLQNRFTALVTVSMSRARIDYLRKEKVRKRKTIVGDFLDEIADDNDFVSEICSLESVAYILNHLDERERYVVIARVLEEKIFDEIGNTIGLKYKGAAAFYYRTLAKLRNTLGGKLI